MKKITWCAVARAPYLDYLLNEVNKHFDLKVYFKIKTNTHPWELDEVDYIHNDIDGNLFQAIRRILTSDIVLVSGWSFWQHLIIMLIPMKSTKKIYFCDTIKLDRERWIGIKGYIRRIIVKIVFTVFDEVWSTGTPGCDALRTLGCKEGKIGSFGFSFDLSRYSNINKEKQNLANTFRARNSNKTTEIIFLCAGRLIPLKRYDNIIEAIARLNNEKAILWIAGSGPQEDELKSLAKKLNIEKQIKFLGWLQKDDIELSFISSDVFVHSALTDAYPNVVLDAMTWGKPIVATYETGSAKDRIVHGISGFLYPTGRIDELTNYMNFFANNNIEIKNFGFESRKTACEYPIDLSIDKLKNALPKS